MPNAPRSMKPRKTSWTFKEISETEFGEPKWLVSDLLPQGFFFVAGKPKQGKSFLCLQLALAVATGQEFLSRQVSSGRVLYVSLEDTARRIKRRTRFMNAIATSNLEIEESWRPLNLGGTDDLVKRLRSKNYLLCIVDPWNKAFRLRDVRDVTETTKAIEPLFNLTRDGIFSFGFVDHHHKSGAFSGDPIEDIHGSIAKGGAADTVWSLQRDRGKERATIVIASRDTEVNEVDIVFDKACLMWHSKEKPAIVPGSNQDKIIQYLRMNDEQSWIREIAEQLHMDPSLVSREINELVIKGLVAKDDKTKPGRPMPVFLLPSSDAK